MGQRYRQLSIEERVEIARLSGAGRSIRQIAASLDRAPSSVARELKRNGAQRGYQPLYAQQQARARRWSGSRLERDARLRDRVLGQLKAGWSPEQIAGRASAFGQASIGTESIYRFIYAQIRRHKDYSWRHYLPRAKSKRGRRGQRGGSAARLMAHRVPLSERPAAVADRLVPGHWEADLMAFSKYGQNILMLHERMSRALIGSSLPSKQAAPVARAIGAALGTLPPELRQTLTFDNGTEFARHYELAPLGIASRLRGNDSVGAQTRPRPVGSKASLPRLPPCAQTSLDI
jgi:IS30 family transposase